MMYEREQFDKQVKQLKARFERNAPNTLFADAERVPIDGMPLFTQGTWRAIRNEEDLDLPN